MLSNPRHTSLLRSLLVALLLLATASQAGAQVQSSEKTRILFLLDASGSMWAKLDDSHRIDVAKRTLTKLVDSLRHIEGIEMGLRVYGHRSPKIKQDCKDTRLEVPFGPGSASNIMEKLKDITPKGTTPIAYSLTQAANDFPADPAKNVIILITDGLEECDGDPCAVSVALQRKGVILRPFIIGLGLNDDLMKQFDCVGRYYNAKDEKSFDKILGVVVSHALNNTTAQVNLLDENSKATETNVNMTFYDHHNKILVHNLYHTMNDRGVPDTLILDPNVTYNLTVHTIPPVEKKNIELNPGRHNVIPLDAPQGVLELKVNGITGYENLQAIVREEGKPVTLHVQPFNTRQKYIIGKYDLEILTLPRIVLQDVDIDQSKTTTIEVAQPGKLQLNAFMDMVGSVYQVEEGQMKWVTNLKTGARREILTMQPGHYRLVYRSKLATQSFLTSEKDFRITSGSSTTVNLR